MSDYYEQQAQQLERARLDVNSLIGQTITTLRGSEEFRNAVEDLLAGTPFAKPDGYDVEGLYGRLRNALGAVARPQPAQE